MDSFKEKLREILDKISQYEFTDFFPVNRLGSSLEDVIKIVGIYLGAMLVAGLLILLLGWIPVLGVLIKIIGAVVGIYSVVGIVEALLKFMRYN